MFKPIKRIFVPKQLALQPMDPVPAVADPEPTLASKPDAAFDELPRPDMEEKNSDSIWAAFETVHPLDIERE